MRHWIAYWRLEPTDSPVGLEPTDSPTELEPTDSPVGLQCTAQQEEGQTDGAAERQPDQR